MSEKLGLVGRKVGMTRIFTEEKPTDTMPVKLHSALRSRLA